MKHDPARLAFRPYREDTDKGCVYSDWLKSYKTFSYFAKRIRPNIFFAGHHKIIDHLMTKPSVKVVIACDKEDTDQIFGWMAYEPRQDKRAMVHFVYVKGPFQRMGIGTALFQNAEIELRDIRFSHWTFPVDTFMEKHPEMVYDPYEL